MTTLTYIRPNHDSPAAIMMNKFQRIQIPNGKTEIGIYYNHKSRQFILVQLFSSKMVSPSLIMIPDTWFRI